MTRVHVTLTLELETDVDETEDWDDIRQMLVQECRVHGVISSWHVPVPEGYELDAGDGELHIKRI